MGATYSSITLRGPIQSRVASALRARGRDAYVGPFVNGCTVLFDRACEEDAAEAERLTAALSRELSCAALGVRVHDSVVLRYWLCDRGRVADRYDSWPGFPRSIYVSPEGGDPGLLCRMVGRPGASPGAAAEVLRTPGREAPYLWAEARHGDLVEALGLPEYAVGIGYESIRLGDEEELEERLLPVGDAPISGGWRGIEAASRAADEEALAGEADGDDLAEDEEEPDAPPPQRVAPTVVAGIGPSWMTVEGVSRPDGGEDEDAAAPHAAHRFWTALLAQDAAGIRDLFAGAPSIDCPRAGRVEGDIALQRYVKETAAWLLDRPSPALYEEVALTEDERRVVAEGVLALDEGGREVRLPVAAVWERAPAGGFAAARVYHTLWPIRGAHTVRPPLLPAERGLAVSGAPGRYQAALAAGDVEGVLAAFEPDGRAREPAGERYVHAGAEALRAFYAALFSNGGGIPLEHCTVTDDGVRCAIEYVVTRWGRDALPPQAGVAVYERGAGGLLRAARIYDDVDPPLRHG